MIINHKIMSKITNVSADMREYETSTLGTNLLGNHSNLKARLDTMSTNLNTKINNNNKILEQNFLNIAKLNERYNIVAKSSSYNLKQMVFDDLIDLSNIDLSLSSSGIVNRVGYVGGANKTIITKEIETGINPQSVLVYARESSSLGFYSNSVYFTGAAITERLTRNNMVFPTTNITVEFWMVAGPNSSGTILSYASGPSENELQIYLRPTGEISFIRNSQSPSLFFPNFGIKDGFPHHVAISSNSSGNIKLYIDGELKFETTSTTHDGNISSGGFFVIGQDQDNGENQGYVLADALTNVHLIEFRIWNSIRTQGEIVGLMNVSLYDYQVELNKAFTDIDNLLTYYPLFGTDDSSINGEDIYFDYGPGGNNLTAHIDFYSTSANEFYLMNYETNACQYSISKNNGSTWKTISPGVISDVSDVVGTKLRLRIIIPSNTSRNINSYGIAWL